MDLSDIDPALLSSIPALPPPPGVKPNFIDPPSQANVARISIYILIPLMLVFLSMRIYTRLRIVRGFGADDYICIAAAIGVCAFCFVSLPMLGNPLGPHQWNVPVSAVFTERILKLTTVALCLYAISAILVKSSLMILYLRIFQPLDHVRYMIWGGIVLITLFYTISCIVYLHDCVPEPGKSWISLATLQRCTKTTLDLSNVQGVFSAVTDFYVLCIPTHLVLGLRLKLGRKIGVCAIFLTGLCACGFSIATSVYRFMDSASLDFTWDGVPCYALGAAELNVGIMCSCMPIVFVLFKGLATRISSSYPVRYIRSRRGTSMSDNKPTKSPSGHLPGGQLLPAVPKGTLSGLRSFIRNAGRTKPAQATFTEPMGSFTDMKSVDEDLDYHTGLRRELGYATTDVREPRQAYTPVGDERIGWAV